MLRDCKGSDHGMNYEQLVARWASLFDTHVFLFHKIETPHFHQKKSERGFKLNCRMISQLIIRGVFLFSLFSSLSSSFGFQEMSDTSLSSSTAEKLVNRMSTGASISDPISSTSTPKDDKVLKMATFSLQKYLKVRTFCGKGQASHSI
jgi:hypothetical protein